MTSATEPSCAESAPLDGPLRHLHVLRAIEDRWSDVLTIEAVRLLQRIARVTVGWNRLEFTCSLKSLISGETGEGDKRHGGKVGCSLATAERALALLRERGLVETKRRQTGLTFIINADGIVQPWEAILLPPVLRTPKKTKVAQSPQREGSVPSEGGFCPLTARALNPQREGYNIRGSLEDLDDKRSPRSVGADALDDTGFFVSDEAEDFAGSETSKTDRPDQKSQQEEPRAPAKNSLREIAAKTTQTYAERMADRHRMRVERIRVAVPKARAPKGVLTSDIRAVWEIAYDATFPHAPVAPDWTAEDHGKAKRTFDRWAPANGHYDEYLTWVIENWVNIVRREFGWMGKDGRGSPAPEHPSIGFLLVHAVKFEDAWAARARRAKAKDAVSEVEELMAKGLSESEAIDQIVARRVKASTRQSPRATVRPRTPPRPAVQPVATDGGLPSDPASPKHVEPARGRFVRGRAMANVEADLFGAGDKGEGE